MKRHLRDPLFYIAIIFWVLYLDAQRYALGG
jgi:hypothetical protein